MKKEDQMYSEDFQRFGKDGLTVTIDFDAEGVVSMATIYVPDLMENVDVTAFVKNDSYWQSCVYERLAQIKETAQQRKYFSAYKDVQNG